MIRLVNLNFRSSVIHKSQILSRLPTTLWQKPIRTQKYSSIPTKISLKSPRLWQPSKQLKTLIISRSFRYRTLKNDLKMEDLGIREKSDGQDMNKEFLKTIFAEGYHAGKVVGKPEPSWKIMIGVFVGGVLIGLFLPIIIISSTGVDIDGDRDIALSSKTSRTTFTDVKGIDEAKQELEDIVEYLRRPFKFTKLGAKLPKGVLLVGPPGTGKTLLARALAGEAGVPYFHMSGSEFEQTFVGEGARKVRELFRIAKKNSPCIIFIDEIDSVGSKRFHNPLHPHSNQTINQLLTEMDGFSKTEGIIVLAATNRKDDLDEALLRPGRFDIEVFIPPPNYNGRKEILEHYLSKVATSDVDIDVLARGTVGFTGADLEGMVNRAALRAGLSDANHVTSDNLLEERDRILMGAARKGSPPDNNANVITAHHEGGHCVVSYFTPHAQPIHKVTIVPRGSSLGHTAYLPEKDEVYISKAQLLANLDSLLGGRAAEELVFGENFVTTGASSDLQTATEIAVQMVTRWGMSTKIGLQTKINGEFSPAIKEQVDEEVRKILQESYERAKAILRRRSEEHLLLVEALLKYETLNSEDIMNVLTKKKKI